MSAAGRNALLVRLYRALLRLLPAPLRERHGGAMEDAFAELYAAERRRGTRALMVLCAGEAIDVIRTGIALRRRSVPAQAPSSSGLAFFSALDVKLGLRMLVKYPGLSLVAVVGMAVAIAIGSGAFSMIAAMMETTLPLADGDRVVALRNATTEPGRSQASLRDYVAWRDELKSVHDVSAFMTVHRNLMVPGAGVELVRVVRMTASGFRVARTAPALGRPLLEEDERTDARVMVIGYEEWQRRFAADPGIIGRRVSLGSAAYTIVGVMPEGFRFPVNDRYWIPLVFGPAQRAHEADVSL